MVGQPICLIQSYQGVWDKCYIVSPTPWSYILPDIFSSPKDLLSLSYICLPILFTSIYAKDKKRLRKFFKDANNLNIQNISVLDAIIDNWTKNLILNYIHDDEHFINEFLPKLPSGRFRTLKYRSSWGKDSFVSNMILSLNNIILTQSTMRCQLFFTYFFLCSMWTAVYQTTNFATYLYVSDK